MKKLLFLFSLSVLIFSCDKEEDTNPQFRPVTCDSLGDDGIFEAYSQPEFQTFLTQYEEVPDAAVAGALEFVRMSSRILYNNGLDLKPVLEYKQTVPTNLTVYLPVDKLGNYYSWIQNDTLVDSLRTVPIYNAKKLNLPEGCHRLYYVFADTVGGKVLDKGHFDIEIKK